MSAIDSRTSSETDHRRLPRAKRAPRARDKAIYVQYHAGRNSQAQLAERYGLSQRRISQIIERVERWRSGTVPSGSQARHPPVVAAPHEKQQLDRELAHAMHQAVYRRAIRSYDNAPRVLTTTKTVEEGQEVVRRETTERQVVPSVSPLRVAQTSAAALERLADKPPIESPEAKSGELLDWEIVSQLTRRRKQAEDEGLVRKSEDTWKMANLCFDALTGDRSQVERCLDDSRAAEFEFLTYFQREVVKNEREGNGPPAEEIFARATDRLVREFGWTEGSDAVEGASNASIVSNRADENDPKSFDSNEMQTRGGFYSEATNRSPGREDSASPVRS